MWKPSQKPRPPTTWFVIRGVKNRICCCWHVRWSNFGGNGGLQVVTWYTTTNRALTVTVTAMTSMSPTSRRPIWVGPVLRLLKWSSIFYLWSMSNVAVCPWKVLKVRLHFRFSLRKGPRSSAVFFKSPRGRTTIFSKLFLKSDLGRPAELCRLFNSIHKNRLWARKWMILQRFWETNSFMLMRRSVLESCGCQVNRPKSP